MCSTFTSIARENIEWVSHNTFLTIIIAHVVNTESLFGKDRNEYAVIVHKKLLNLPATYAGSKTPHHWYCWWHIFSINCQHFYWSYLYVLICVANIWRFRVWVRFRCFLQPLYNSLLPIFQTNQPKCASLPGKIQHVTIEQWLKAICESKLLVRARQNLQHNCSHAISTFATLITLHQFIWDKYFC